MEKTVLNEINVVLKKLLLNAINAVFLKKLLLNEMLSLLLQAVDFDS